jgi:nicotinate-nucleotide adenylyltransferase
MTRQGRSKLRRALLGGTFDPPHIGHLVAGQVAWEQLEVDVVTYLPAGQPWQKTARPLTPSIIRAEMIEAAVAGVAYFEADRREVEREGPTYTWDTVSSFDGDEVVLVMGADTAAGIPTWHRGEELLDRVELAVVERIGTERGEVLAGGGLRWLEMPRLDVSGTEVRRWIGSGFSARFLVPDAVLAIVARHGLYREEVVPDEPVD